MSKYASQIQHQENCGADYQAQNPLVIQASVGLSAYDIMYTAGCLKDTKGAYCFADFITNSTKIEDTYPYYLPLGISLPPGSAPDCNSCVQRTMQTYSAAAVKSGQLISKTYPSAAQVIDTQCGGSFIPSKVKVSAASSQAISVMTALFSTLIISFILR